MNTIFWFRETEEGQLRAGKGREKKKRKRKEKREDKSGHMPVLRRF